MLQEPRRSHCRVLRPGKAFAKMDWNGRNYHLSVRSAADVRESLRNAGVTHVVVRENAAARLSPHAALLNEAVREWRGMAASDLADERAGSLGHLQKENTEGAA